MSRDIGNTLNPYLGRRGFGPGGECPCPHWGVVLKGRMIVRYADHEEVVEAGDAFYMAPGHAPEAEEGTELIQFSPADQLAAVEAALAAAMQQS